MAAFMGHASAIKLLLDKGKANINSPNKDGMTPIHWAILQRHYPCITLLIQRGANMELKNEKGQTPPDMVQRLKGSKNRTQMEQFLIQCMSGNPPQIPTTQPPTTPNGSSTPTPHTTSPIVSSSNSTVSSTPTATPIKTNDANNNNNITPTSPLKRENSASSTGKTTVTLTASQISNSTHVRYSYINQMI